LVTYVSQATVISKDNYEEGNAETLVTSVETVSSVENPHSNIAGKYNFIHRHLVFYEKLSLEKKKTIFCVHRTSYVNI